MGKKSAGKTGKTYAERECKLNARSVAQLRRVKKHILKNSHYVTQEDERFRPEVLRGLRLLGAPEIVTPIRIRTYYDDERLRGFHNNVEIRVEPKDDGEWKMTVKMGANRAGKNGTLNRREYPVGLDSPVPDLKALHAAQKKILKEIFDAKNLDDVRLRPMIEIVSQRQRIEYHPGGDPKTVIEYAHDVARARTFTGYSWKLFQIELEMKKGSAKYLPAEKKRLLDAFNFLTPETRSKPSKGFDILTHQLTSAAARKFVKRRLTPGKFKAWPSPPFHA